MERLKRLDEQLVQLESARDQGRPRELDAIGPRAAPLALGTVEEPTIKAPPPNYLVANIPAVERMMDAAVQVIHDIPFVSFMDHSRLEGPCFAEPCISARQRIDRSGVVVEVVN